MESLKELYGEIENPLDDIEKMQKLINAYSNSSQGFGGFYDKLVKTTEKQYIRGEHYRKDSDEFWATMFNKWKNGIVNLTFEQFKELAKIGSFGRDLKVLREYLKNVPDVITEKEANDIFNKKFEDKELETAMEKYSYKSFGMGTGWQHIASRYLTGKQDELPHVSHRLYLNTESVDTYKMLNCLVKKFDDYKLPFYFKFDQYGDRDDTIVLYSDTQNLLNYVNILEEIKKENLELISRTKEPPVLTGTIDGWIGYGSEPEKTQSGKKQSFNSKREKIIEGIIDKATKDWIVQHKNDIITMKNNEQIKLTEYIARKMTKNKIEDLKKTFIYKGKNVSESEIAQRKGYTLQDLESNVFKNSMQSGINRNVENGVIRICRGAKPDELTTLHMNVSNGKKIDVSGYDLENAMKELATEIASHDKEFVNRIKNEIQAQAKMYGIDEKFCFDKARVCEMQEYNRKHKKEENISTDVQEQSIKETEKILTKGKKVEYDKNTQEAKDSYIKRLIQIYDKLETNQDFETRERREPKNMQQVLNATQMMRCTQGFMNCFEKQNKCFSEDQIKTMMRALKAADALTVTVGKDYLKEFTSVPFIDDILKEMQRDKTVLDMRKKADKIHQYEVKETTADKDKIIVEEHLSSSELKTVSAKEELKKYGRNDCSTAYRLTDTEDWSIKKLAMWRLTARQQGFVVGNLSKEDSQGMRLLSLKNRQSSIVSLEDMNQFAQSKIVLDCVVNGKKYEAMRDKKIDIERNIK